MFDKIDLRFICESFILLAKYKKHVSSIYLKELSKSHSYVDPERSIIYSQLRFAQFAR